MTTILNGSTDDSPEVALEAARRCEVPIAIYTIAHGDKANAINHFYHTLREPARHYGFVDGYVTIGPDALVEMEACIARPGVIAATGISLNGRTMRDHTQPTLTEGGTLQGGLHALRPDFLDRLVARNIRLPIGLYRGDGLIGSMVLHNLDPLHVEWDQTRIAGSPGASFEIPVASLFRLRDLNRQFRRKVRQMRGQLENLAIRSIVYDKGYEGLPAYADEMIHAYLATHDLPGVPPLDRPFQALALRQIQQFRRPAPELLAPVLVHADK
ncbi:MAG: hypothetical protein EXR07_21760 [Acetobacteraceae bacterium]|nr:hypothetical protein [Acetobacteraceae bacterium]